MDVYRSYLFAQNCALVVENCVVWCWLIRLRDIRHLKDRGAGTGSRVTYNDRRPVFLDFASVCVSALYEYAIATSQFTYRSHLTARPSS